MSGENCFNVLEKIFVPKHKQSIEEIKGYTMKYGNIVDEDGKEIDEVLVSYFKAPKSYTTENMCEINSHGGNIVEKEILELCLKNGANLAEPGEFTKRAFLNGRIDLLQAESVIDIINAKSEREAKNSIHQLKGSLSNEIAQIKKEIMDVMVNIEVVLDYPEYDVEDVTKNQIEAMLNSVGKKLKKLEKSYDNGKIIKDGIKTAIIGKPNAGKSSLLNAILKEDRAIVTEYEGTTRDTIEEFVNINGIPLKLIDTAGIRDTKDEVEQIGINKSKEAVKEAELVIAIIDASKPIEQEDINILNLTKGKKAILVLNKTDLKQELDEKCSEIRGFEGPIVKISAIKNEGIDDLYAEITKMYDLNKINLDHDVLITNIRQKNLIDKAIKSTQKAQESLEKNVPVDIVAIFIKEILENLGEITGDVVTDSIIDEIFSKFCLGK